MMCLILLKAAIKLNLTQVLQNRGEFLGTLLSFSDKAQQ